MYRLIALIIAIGSVCAIGLRADSTTLSAAHASDLFA